MIRHFARRSFPTAVCVLLVLTAATLFAQNQDLQPITIVGKVQVARVGMPSHRLLVTIYSRGISVGSTYTDSEGKFAFYQLDASHYTVRVDDPDYNSVQVDVTANLGVQPTYRVVLDLTPKNKAAAPKSAAGANPNLVSSAALEQQIPSDALKAFGNGVKADRKHDGDRAIQSYQKAIKIAPGYYEARNNLGTDLLSKGDFAGAEEQFKKVIELNPADAAGYFNLANVEMLTQHLREAQKDADEGLQRQPDSAVGNFIAGSIHCRNGEAAEGERLLNRALQLDATQVRARLELVNLYLRQGRRDDAIKQLELFISAAPHDPLAPKARSVLDSLRAQGGKPS